MITVGVCLALFVEWLWICRLVRRNRMYIGYAALWFPMLILGGCLSAAMEFYLAVPPAGTVLGGFALVALFMGLIYITSVISILAENMRRMARQIALAQLPASSGVSRIP